MSVLAVSAVTVVPALAAALMVDERQVSEGRVGLLLQLVASKLQMLRVLVLAVDEADGNKDQDPLSCVTAWKL